MARLQPKTPKRGSSNEPMGVGGGNEGTGDWFTFWLTRAQEGGKGVLDRNHQTIRVQMFSSEDYEPFPPYYGVGMFESFRNKSSWMWTCLGTQGKVGSHGVDLIELSWVFAERRPAIELGLRSFYRLAINLSVSPSSLRDLPIGTD